MEDNKDKNIENLGDLEIDENAENVEVDGVEDDDNNGNGDKEHVEGDIDDNDIDIMIKFSTNNHKIEGKHALKRDTIFKGKINESPDVDQYSTADDFYSSDGFPIETGSNYEFESRYHDEYVNKIELSKSVYDLLQENTELDFTSNRRKPNKQAFNDYYRMLLDNLGKKYNKSEIFVELSYYFTDNIFNMFKLLNKEYATQIIIELKQGGYLDNLSNINFI